MINSPGGSLHLPSILTRFVVFAVLSVALMMLDHRGQHLEKIRAGLGVLFYPLQVAAALPARTGAAVMDFIGGDRVLREKYERLNDERPGLLARLEKFEALEAENNHLRSLLGSAERIAEHAEVAELVEVSQEPFTRKIVLAKGSRDKLYIGQPIIDAYGIMGQITQVGLLQSQATLITDPDHAIPVQVNRNGLRAIVFGTGARDGLAVRYLTSSADIQEGDTLISSGMGGSFPFGYPVAVVSHIVNDPNESFLDISARPVAHLGHNKEVLLIWPARAAAASPAPKAETKTSGAKNARTPQ
jgi:rod shape-determining protein MreC